MCYGWLQVQALRVLQVLQVLQVVAGVERHVTETPGKRQEREPNRNTEPGDHTLQSHLW